MENVNDKQNYNLKELIKKTKKELEISEKDRKNSFQKRYTLFAIMFGGNNPEKFLKDWKTKSKNEKIFSSIIYISTRTYFCSWKEPS